jgi:hypothetical protein
MKLQELRPIRHAPIAIRSANSEQKKRGRHTCGFDGSVSKFLKSGSGLVRFVQVLDERRRGRLACLAEAHTLSIGTVSFKIAVECAKTG